MDSGKTTVVGEGKSKEAGELPATRSV